MGSLVSPIVANLYMEHFERKALQSASHPLGIGLGLWMTLGSSNKRLTNRHFWIISISQIQQSSLQQKVNKEMGPFPFLDTLVTPQADNSLSITVYHKPTHTDQYLEWDSHHNLSAKYSVIGTLTHRAKTVCTRPELFQRELEHLREALVKCKYPHWAISRVQSKYTNSNLEDDSSNNNSLQDNSSQTNANMDQANNNRDNNNTQQDTHNLSTSREETPQQWQKPSIGFVIIHLIKGISESIKKICGTVQNTNLLERKHSNQTAPHET